MPKINKQINNNTYKNTKAEIPCTESTTSAFMAKTCEQQNQNALTKHPEFERNKQISGQVYNKRKNREILATKKKKRKRNFSLIKGMIRERIETLEFDSVAPTSFWLFPQGNEIIVCVW